MIEVVEKKNRWIVRKGREAIVVYKNRDRAVYGRDGKIQYISDCEPIRGYFESEITEKEFEEIKRYIMYNAFLW